MTSYQMHQRKPLLHNDRRFSGNIYDQGRLLMMPQGGISDPNTSSQGTSPVYGIYSGQPMMMNNNGGGGMPF